jgi:hypothetical protein
MDWTTVIEQGIIGGLFGGLAFLLAKTIGFFKKNEIQVDTDGIKRDYKSVISKLKLPKVKIPYVKIKDKNPVEWEFSNTTEPVRATSTKKDSSTQPSHQKTYNLNQKSNLGVLFILATIVVFGLIILFLSSLSV